MPESTATHTTSNAALLWLAQWAGFLGSWVLFVGSFDIPDLLAGIAAAAIAATASQVVWAEDLARLSVQLRPLAQAWRLPEYLVTGTGEILAVLARHVLTRTKAPSLLRAVRYRAVGEDPRSATLRALAIGYTTIAPNFVVLGVDRERGYLLFHQLRRSEIPQMTKNLGAEP